MTVRVRVDDRAARKLLAELSGRELKNRMRRATRAGAKVLRAEVRQEARSRADLPRSFARTQTINHSNLSVSTGPTSPLLNIFEGGAGEHPIGERGQLLHSQQGEPFFAARGPVRHPGMDARPLIGPVFDREKDDAAAEGMSTLVEGISAT
jgi:hypothetical protein